VLLRVPKLGWVLFALHCLWITVKVIGAKIEGLRMSQLFNGVVFTIWSLFYFITIAVTRKPAKFNSVSIANSILTAFVAIFWLQNVFYTQKLGAGDFSKLRIDGPYKVGVRYFHFKTKDLEAMCFYPIDEDEYKRNLKTRNARWMYRPEQILKGMQNVYKNWFGISIPAFMLRPQ
jgi:hypothetical protein